MTTINFLNHLSNQKWDNLAAYNDSALIFDRYAGMDGVKMKDMEQKFNPTLEWNLVYQQIM